MKVKIVQYKWAGKKGPFEIKSKCEECNLTTAVINDMMKKEFKNKNIKFEIKPWLDNVFYVLFKGAWHAPIIFVNGKKFFQYTSKKPLFDREELKELVFKELKRKS